MASSNNPQNTGGGTTISFGNTPQAKDDNLLSAQTGITEDTKSVFILDVMANDLGGNAKALWSVDNGVNNSGAMSGKVEGDLLTEDTARTAALSNDTSLNGAKIWITSDGKVGYDTTTLTASFAAQLQALPVGQTLTDSFIYAIRLAAGTLSWAKATVEFKGVNDAPVITSTAAAALGSVKEDTALTATGQLSASDVDTGATQAWSVVGAATGTYGSIAVNPANGAWTYTLSNGTNGVASVVQSLAAGETKTESFTIRVSDGLGGTADQVVTLTITGTNDAPVITSTAAAAQGATTEDTALSATGQLTAADIDNGATQAWSVVGSGTGTYGNIAVNAATGQWTYTLANGTNGVASAVQSLAVGETKTESFTIQVSDGQGGTASQVVTLTITGTNDAPVITSSAAAAQGAATEDTGLSTSGQLTAADIDNGATQAWSVSGSNVGTYGSIAVNGSTGAWTYTLANGTNGVSSIVQNLAEGQSVTDSFTVVVDDSKGGTASQVVTVTITGTNDAPVITSTAAAAQGAVQEDATSTASGQLTAADIDNGATQAWSVSGSNAGTYGSIAVNGSTGAWTYTLANGTNGASSIVQNLAAGQSVTDSFTVVVDDSKGGTASQVVTVTITGTNDAPVITSTAAAAQGAVQEDGVQVANGQLTAADIDNGATQAWSVSGSNAGTYGSIGVDSSGKWTYTLANGSSTVQTLNKGQVVTDTFTIQVDDSKGGVATQVVTVNTTGTNDAPTLAAGSMATNEDNAASLNLAPLGDDVDAENDGSNLLYSVTAPTKGTAGVAGTTLTFNPGNDYQYLAVGQSATVNLQVQAKDAQSAVANNTVTVTVAGVNDAPEITGGDPIGSVTATPGVAAFTVQQWNNYPSGDFSLASLQTYTSGRAPNYTVTTNVIDYTDDPGGFAGQIPGSTPWPAAAATGASGTGAAVNDHFIARITGQLVVTATDTYTFQTYNDDGVYLRVNNQLVISDSTQHPEAVFTGSITLNPGVYPIELFFFENGGEASLEFTYRNSTGSYTHVVAADKVADAGVILFRDVDLTDTHTVGVTSNGANLGSLTAAVTKDSTGTGTGGQVGWNYSVDNKAIAYLGKGESKVETFTVNVKDNNGASAQQVVTVTVNGVNDAPTITSTTDQAKGNVMEDTTLAVSGQITASDVDANDTKTWSISSNTNGTYGSASVDSNGKWTYTLNNGTNGVASAVQNLSQGQTLTETFTVRVTDSAGANADQVVQVVVAGVNDAAVIGSSSASMNESNAVQNASGTVTATDIDSASTFQAQTLTGAYGNLTMQSNGTWSYVMNGPHDELQAGKNYSDVFKATTADGTTRADAVTITIAGTNDAAVITTQSKNLVETNAPLSTSGQLAVTDVDSSNALVAQSNVAGTYGNFSIAADGSWTYTMNGAHDEFVPNQNYTDSFSVTSADGTVKANAVTVTITGTSDGPTAVDDSNSLKASNVVANTSNVVYWVDWSTVQITGPRVGDPNTGDAPVKVTGTITLGDGHQIGVSYEGLAFFVNANEQTYVYSGGNVNTYMWTQPNSGNLAYTSSQVNAAPSTKDIIALNEAFLGGGFQNASNSRTDFAPRNLTFSEPVDNLFFAVLSMNSNGYKLDQNFQIASQGQGMFGSQEPEISPTNFGNGQYGIVSPGEFHGVLKLDGSVDHLTWVSQNKETWNGFTVGTYGKAQTSTAAGNVLTNDIKGLPTSLLEVSSAGGSNMVGSSVTLTLASGATVKVDRDGDYFFDDKGKYASLNGSQSVTESVNYTVKDDQGYTDTGVLNIVINGVNDAPVAAADAATVNEDGSVTINVLSNDTDVDAGDTKSLLSVTTAAHGTVSMSGSSVVYTPAANYNGADSFSYTMKDAGGLTSTATVSVTVNAVNDAPTVSFAAPLVITNGAFAGNANGWTSLAGGVDVVENGGWRSSEGTAGTYSVDLNAFTKGGLKQTLTTVVGVTYAIDFMFSKNPGETGTAIMQVGATGNPSVDYTTSAANTASNMLWTQKTYTFTATSTSTELSFTSLTPSTSLGFPGDAQGPALDNVAVGADIGAFEDTVSTIKGITITDIDATGGIQLTLSVGHGILGLNSTAGLTGDINGTDGSMSFTGTQAAINAALAGGLIYKGALNYNGTDTLTATVNDLGQTGSPGALSQTKTQSIDVAPVGEKITIPGTIVLNGSFESSSNYWTSTGGGIDVVNNTGWQSADGTYSVDLNAFSPGGVQQVVNTTNGTTYSMSFMMSKNPGSGATYNSSATLRVAAAGSQQDYVFNSANNTTDMMWTQKTFSFVASAGTTTLSISSLSPSPTSNPPAFPVDAQGPALDDVIVVGNTIYNNFLKGAYGDVLDLSTLLNSFGGPRNSNAFTNGFLRFQQSGSDTLIQIDPNGGGDHYLTAATLVGVQLTQADTYNYSY